MIKKEVRIAEQRGKKREDGQMRNEVQSGEKIVRKNRFDGSARGEGGTASAKPAGEAGPNVGRMVKSNKRKNTGGDSAKANKRIDGMFCVIEFTEGSRVVGGNGLFELFAFGEGVSGEVVVENADDVFLVVEAGLDLEAEAVERDDVIGGQGQVGGHQNHFAEWPCK
jgi:hypothetical protein